MEDKSNISVFSHENQLFVYDFRCSISDVIHPLYPLHRRRRFQFFRHIFLFSKCFYKKLKHTFCLTIYLC